MLANICYDGIHCSANHLFFVFPIVIIILCVYEYFVAIAIRFFLNYCITLVTFHSSAQLKYVAGSGIGVKSKTKWNIISVSMYHLSKCVFVVPFIC